MIFRNQADKYPLKLIQKRIKDIKNVTEGTTFKQWYFNACILTHPQTIIIQQQIRQAIFVFEQRKLQEVLVVILCQAAVRRYCNSLKPFKKFKIINGAIKTSYLSNNFLFITEESQMVQIKFQVQQGKKPSSVIQKIFASRNNKSKKQQQKKITVSLSIPNVSVLDESDDQDYQHSFYSNQNAKSQKILDRNSCKTDKNNEQLVTFCGKIISIYEVGKGKMNHGTGYKIEQCFSMVTYEVVVWCEMQYDHLKKGRIYQFRNFRPHKKQNSQISYHSHPQLSTIDEIN